jgi:hypothetical protein
VPTPLPPEVSGRAFLGLISHVRAGHGATALAEIVAAAGAPARQAFAARIRVLDWLPYEAYVGFLRSLERHLADGDHLYLRALGAAAGQRDLGTILRVYVALASPERLIRSCTKVWDSYYRHAGHMEAISWAPEQTILRILDFPAMDRTHCRLMEGWMISTMEHLGFRVAPGARETECPSRGGRHHEFRCTWSRGRAST